MLNRLSIHKGHAILLIFVMILSSSQITAKDHRSDSLQITALFQKLDSFLDINTDSVISVANMAYHIAVTSGDLRLKQLVYRKFANTYYDRGNTILALEYFFKEIEVLDALRRKKRNPIDLHEYYPAAIRAKANIANCYMLLKQTELAFKYWDETLALIEEADERASGSVPDRYRMMIYANIGGGYLGLEQYIQALELLRKAESLNHIINDTIAWASLNQNIGIVYQNLGDQDSANRYFQESLRFWEILSDSRGMAGIYNNIGKGYHMTGDLKRARNAFEQAYKLAKESNAVLSLQIASSNLAELYYALGDLNKAFEMSQLSIKLNDSIFHSSRIETITRLSNQYNFENKIALYELEQESISRKEKQKRIVLGLLVGVLSLVIVSGSLFIINQRNKIKLAGLREEKLLLEQGSLAIEQKRVQESLEQKTKELATNAMYLIRKNEFIAEVASSLNSFMKECPADAAPYLRRMVAQLVRQTEDNSWDEFELRFHQVHQDFYAKLQAAYPDLSPGERKLAAFLKLNMTTKDIAAITRQQPDSIKVARSRLRKKLGLGQEENLVSFLERF